MAKETGASGATARVMESPERASVLAALRRTGPWIVERFDGGERELGLRYRAGGWSVREILAHLADVEFINLWRFCRAAAEPGSRVEAYEEKPWSTRLGYATRPPSVDRDLFDATRNALISYVGTLPDDVLTGGWCEHPEKGRLTPLQWAALTNAHAEHHLSQLEAARSGKPWKAEPRPDAWMYTGAKRP